MEHHAFSPRAAAAAAGMAVLLVGGTTTGAMAAVTSASAPSARQGTPTVPGPPEGLTAASGNGTATLSWSAPGSDGGSPVEDYVIEGGTSPSGGGIEDNVGGETATIGGLTNGTAYYFRVHAQNAYGDGAFATVTVTPQGPGSVPGSPTGLKTSYGDGFIALSWSPPTSTGGSPVTGYHVYLGYSSSFVGAREFTTSGTSFRLTDAENGSQYYFRVLAVGANSVSLPSNETSVFLGAGTATGTGTSAGSGTISVSSSGVVTASGAGHGQPSAAPRPGTELASDSASSGLPTGLIVLLVALVLAAAAGGATAVMLLRRRRYDRRYSPVPAPRRPHDDQLTGQSGRSEEMNGPRYR